MDESSNENNNNICKKYDEMKVYVTGYGPFQTILDNPSQELCEKLCSELECHKDIFDEKCQIAHKEILEVNVDYVREKIKDLHNLIEENCKTDFNKKTFHLIVHCGVNTNSDKVHLEKKSKNKITDYQKIFNKKISNECQESHLTCKLDLERICESLICKGHQCKVSEDAGNYLCNFVYFLSNNKFNENPDVSVLFFHIPEFITMPLEDTHKVLIYFINEVKNIYVK